MTASDPAPLVLRGGTVFDGLGSPGGIADILVIHGMVQHVGIVDAPAGTRTIDCDGLFIAPGFIDVHSHSDLAPFLRDPDPFKLLQGVTTEINGNCGISFAPTTAESATHLSNALHDVVRDVDVHPMSFGEFLDAAAEAGPTNHVAYLVGHGTLRLFANGTGEQLGAQALAKMTELAAEALAAGALGFSTGLIYPPGCYADLRELQKLARVASVYGAIYATHMRDEGGHVLEAIEEAVAIAKAGALRLQISHCKLTGKENHGRADELVRRIESARLSGVDVLGDQYPYTAAATALATLLPNTAMSGGPEELRARLAAPAYRAALLEQVQRGLPGDGIWGEAPPDAITITSHRKSGVQGRTLADLAGARDAFDVACELIGADPAAGMMIESMSEADVQDIMASPLMCVGSDNALPGSGPIHPRSIGTFPRLLGRYVRELNVLTWPEAIRKATSLAAAHFGLHRRGTLLPGSHADLVVFDPTTIDHVSSAIAPVRPVGVQTVVLAGVPVIRNGSFTGERRGQVIRRQPR
jgi:N-acyl-D-amino-acid deacylase